MFSFRQRNNRLHLQFDHNDYPLVDPFIQTEAASFKDVITQIISKFQQDSIPQKFSGNIFSLTLTDSIVIIEDQISNEKNLLPTPLFIEIYQQWLNLTNN